MRDYSNVDTNNIVSVIKGTVRGKIAVVLAVLGVFLFFATNDGYGIMRLITCLLIAGILIGQASKSIEKKRANIADAVEEQKLNNIKKGATKRIGNYLYVNEDAETWCVPYVGAKEYSFSDLLDFSVVQDGETISSANLLNAVAGGAVFGLAGVLVGANKTKTSSTCSKLQVQMNVNSISNPVIRIDLLPYEVKRSDDRYKKALETMEEITGVLRVIKSRNQH